ncbi:MAG: ferritin-like domain-containing protein [Tepidisphaeraceae bacterium]
MFDLHALGRDSASRRQFLAVMTAAGLGLAAHQLFAADGTTPTPPPVGGGTANGVPTDFTAQFGSFPGAGDQKVLNFALTLEILEADLYRQALNIASGKSITAPLGAASSYSRKVGGGGLNADDTSEGYQYLKDFTFVEAAHRDFLRTVLGSVAVKPNANGYKFPKAPAANIASLLTAILPLEETGVRAYLGALPYLTNLATAQVAGGIFSTEARHSAVVAYTLGVDIGPRKLPGDRMVTATYPSQNTFEYFLTPREVLSAAAVYFK